MFCGVGKNGPWLEAWEAVDGDGDVGERLVRNELRGWGLIRGGGGEARW